ncbi:phenylalanyl-tRNA synthetase subunit beta [Clostridium putrefaciens]|uniref:Phenylalanine--tRNA ligase beta subunit n=1 Tax=Clostridium putrefaciens TaxID=99675 RepID=A0A381J6X8_9CLOT|nr:phenylalanine--tRNA ligase subunit beta [Clostridium putrefaciens]SUY46991.1 phenylalanyl-tRNA synthetase subunit beta [Clostridium putrefaciens]
MKVPFTWLKDYVDIDINVNELADRLTLSGSKVEEVITTGDEIENVVTARIVKIEPHPDADKLVICQLDIRKDEYLQIVTGAKNMKEGDIVPAALHGASLANGLKIKKGKLRGIVSNGMMCSEEELGLAEEGTALGLMILPMDTPIGEDIKEVLGLNTSIIDFEITSNRTDCMSVVGIARETAATLDVKYKMPNINYNVSGEEDIKDMIKLQVKDSLCKRYMARAIKNVKIEPSPSWMQERLLEAGIRPINNIVDITNFVMIELGQPMHAFDMRDIKGNSIIVERAKAEERFISLDEVERDLNESVLTIRDEERAIALAGIIGGLNSQIKEDTNVVILECANFDGTNIRVNAKKLGVRTESSSLFEKDLDPNLTNIALDRACSLIEELKVGQIISGTIDYYEDKVVEKELTVDYKWINKFLGTSLSKEDIKGYLDRLELKTLLKEDMLIINVPIFRKDISIKEDVAEEVARIYGYNNIPSTINKTINLKDGKNLKQKLDDKVISVLLNSGLNQSISYSFVSPKVFDKINMSKENILRDTISIKNPLGENYSIMRTTCIPSMMESLARNYSRNNEEVSLFEIGNVYIKTNKDLPEERNTLVIGLYGKVEYLNLKGVIENLVESLGIEKTHYERQSQDQAFHPGKTANLFIGKECAGILGEVHPDVTENYGIDTECYIAEINLDVLYKNANIVKKYKALPRFPAVTRDIALIVDEATFVQKIQSVIKSTGGNLVESINLFDVYKGKQIEDGKKSVAYAISYRSETKTLTDGEVNKVHDKIVRALEYKLGCKLR